jgi:hypothetical protein
MRRGDWVGPPLTTHQLRVLTAVVSLSRTSAGDLDARAVAEHAGMRLNSVVVILQSLAKRRLVLRHRGTEPDEPDVWTPTLTGYARVRHFRHDGDEAHAHGADPERRHDADLGHDHRADVRHGRHAERGRRRHAEPEQASDAEGDGPARRGHPAERDGG